MIWLIRLPAENSRLVHATNEACEKYFSFFLLQKSRVLAIQPKIPLIWTEKQKERFIFREFRAAIVDYVPRDSAVPVRIETSENSVPFATPVFSLLSRVAQNGKRHFFGWCADFRRQPL